MVAGVIGLLVVLIVAVSLLGTKAEPQFRQIDMGANALPGGGLGDVEVIEEPITTIANPGGAQVDDPISTIEAACRDSRSDEEPLRPWTAFNAVTPGGEGQYAQVVRMGPYGPAWVASINLASGAIEDGSDPDRLIEMGRQTSVVVCALPMEDVPNRMRTRCTSRKPDRDGAQREYFYLLAETRGVMQTYEMTSGSYLGRGEVESGPVACPPGGADAKEGMVPEFTDLHLATWASQHLRGGRFQ